MKNIEYRVKNIISKKLDIKLKDICNESSFIEDLGADSLDIVELMMALEEEFNIEISDESAENINTVQQSIDYIIKKHKN